MKWIKTFEELKPDTYRKAGKKLVSIGHAERGGKLVDYSHEKESGLYNMFLCKTRTLQGPKGKTYSFSFSKYDVIYGTGMELEDILQQWRAGNRELEIEIRFYFRPTSVTINSLSGSVKSDMGEDYPLFSIKYTLAICEEDPDEYFDGLSDLYESNEWLNLRTEYTNDTLFGIFSDRKSASLFTKNVLPGAIDMAKEKLFDLYSAIGTPNEYYENCIDGLKHITANHLYRNKLEDNLGNTLGGSGLVNAMYCTILENIHER